jgi:hypothetical protein
MGDRERHIFHEIKKLRKRNFTRVDWFQKKLARGQANEWRCRSGSRYLYICEDGLVHHCSQQRGYPGIPLDEYTPELRRREYFSQKHCAPLCTISCVQQVATIDNWRDPRWMAPLPARPPVPASLVQVQPQSKLAEQTDPAPAD